MQTLTIQPDKEIEVPSVHEFRSWFDRLKCPIRDKIFLELLYLTGSRESELCKKVLRWEVEHNKAKPYGELLKYELEKYQMSNGQVIPILLLRLGVGKHRVVEEKIPSQDPQLSQNTDAFSQINYKVKVRYVPIPLRLEFEPWAMELMQFLKKSKLEFDFTRRTAYNICRRNLAIFEPSMHPHLLRHFRATHLLEAYHFTPLQLTSFFGWSIQTTFKQLGMISSANVDVYSHTKWIDYVEKLLVPIDAIK